MATTQMGGEKLTLYEVAKRTNNGAVLTISEVLSRVEEWLMDAVWVPANNFGTHIHNRRLTLPTGTWRKQNYGAAIESSVTKQVTENIGRLEAWSQIDEDVLGTLLGDQAGFRNSEDMAFVMGLGQTLGTALITADTTTDPEKFDGLNCRLNALTSSDATVLNSKSAGGSGSDLTSVYFIQWDPNYVHMIYQPDVGAPSQGSPVKFKDHGLETIVDAGGGLFTGYRSQFVVTAGLAIHDDRCVGRLSNIEDDVSGANIFEPDLAIEILNNMFSRGKGTIMYAHQKVLSQLDVMAMDKANVMYNTQNLWGEPVTFFRGNVPIRQFDGITITQSAVA